MLKVLITGGKGRLAHAVAPAFARANWEVVSLSHDDLDITSPNLVLSTMRSVKPDALINLAAWTDADACEDNPERAQLVNTFAVRGLANACLDVGAHLCHVSSDYVFDGAQTQPYKETDPPNPLSVYGKSKLAAEAEAGPDATVVRVAWLSGTHGRSFARTVIDQASQNSAPLRYVVDQVGSPTVTDGVASVILQLVSNRAHGLFHATNAGSASRFDVARHIMKVAGYDAERVQPIVTADLRPSLAAHRPAYSVLDNHALRGLGYTELPPWEDAMSELVQRLQAGQRTLTTRSA